MMMLQFVLDTPPPPEPLPVARPATRPVQPEPRAVLHGAHATATDIPSAQALSERVTAPYSAVMAAAALRSRRPSERPTLPYYAAAAIQACRVTRPSMQAVAITAQRSSRRLALAAAFLLAVLALLTIGFAPAWARAQGLLAPSGELDEALIARTARAHRAAIEACYDDALAGSPELAGRMVVDLRVGSNGSVLAAAVRHATFDAPALQACVLDEVEGWRFPGRFGPPVRVLVPFEFAPAVAVPAPSSTFAVSVGTSAFRLRLREHHGVQACYEQALAQDPAVEGELTVLFTVDPTGAITVVEPVGSTLNAPALESCVLDALLDVTVPSFQGKGATTLQTELRFSPTR